MVTSLNKCATCKWFGHSLATSPDGIADCGFIDTIQATEDKRTFVDIQASAADDQGLNATLMVGSGFGCLHHTPKKRRQQPTYYVVNFLTWNAAISENVTRNYQPLELSDTIATVNELIDKGCKGITIDELAAGVKKVTGQVVKRWGPSELLVANADTYPIRGADPDAY
jgi:hypothetical protein